jgi:hypothetical protein
MSCCCKSCKPSGKPSVHHGWYDVVCMCNQRRY